MLLLQTERDFLDDLWRRLADVPTIVANLLPSLAQLCQSEWVPDFIQYMRNRMVQGAFRYGLLKDHDFSKYDLPQAIRDRLILYEKDHNLEHLVDAGNICMIAFLHGQRIGHVMRPTDDLIHNQEVS